MTNKQLHRFVTLSFALALALVLPLWLSMAYPTEAASYTVDTVVDENDGSCSDGDCSLRDAIVLANNNPGPDTISFNIPGCGGVCTIQPGSALPALTGDGTTIDGYSQSGAAEATDVMSATLLIEIDGTNAGGGINGFTINSAGNTIRGLVINRFSQHGVSIWGSSATGNTVSGNYIGIDAGGMAELDNTRHGVYIIWDAQNNTVGPDNVIAYNSWDGVAVDGSSTTGNTITQNSIFSNTLGIDLTNGANGDIAAPTIVTTILGSVTVVGTACANCTVEVFENDDTDGEGQTYVGDTTADASGAFTVTVSSLGHPYLTATATDAVSGTSDFSAVFTAPIPNFSTSTKSVDRTAVSAGGVLTYTITLGNTGTGAAVTANVTDTLPASVTWAGRFSASTGTPTWDGGNNRLLWSGPVDVGLPVAITYQVTVNLSVPGGTLITNTAIVDDGAGNVGETGPVTVIVASEVPDTNKGDLKWTNDDCFDPSDPQCK